MKIVKGRNDWLQAAKINRMLFKLPTISEIIKWNTKGVVYVI